MIAYPSIVFFKSALISSKFRVKIVVSLLLMIILGACNQPAGDPPETARIGLNDGKELTVLGFAAEEFADPPLFVSPDDVEVTVTNQWDTATGVLNVLISGSDVDIFAVSPAKIDSLAPGESAVITVKMAKTNPRKAVTYKVDLLVGNNIAAGKLPIAYKVSPYIPDDTITITPELLKAGITAPAVATATRPTGSAGDWFSTNPKVAVVDENGRITVHSAGEVIIGLLASDGNGSLQLKGKKTTIAEPMFAQTAGDENAKSSNQIQIEFSEQIQAITTIEGLTVAINELPTSITSISVTDNILTVTIVDAMTFSDSMAISYNGAGNLASTAGAAFPEFSVPVQNNFTIYNITSGYVSVSASNTHSASYTVDRAFDGNPATRWATSSQWNNGGNGVTSTLVYGTPKSVQQIKIASFGTRITKFNFDYSSDGVIWQTAYSYSSDNAVEGSQTNGSIVVPFVFSEVTATHFRLHILEANDDPTIWEIELWG